MRRHHSLLMYCLVMGCDLPTEIGNDAAIGGALVLSPCQDDCDEPGALRWEQPLSMQRPRVLAHSSGEVLVAGIDDGVPSRLVLQRFDDGGHSLGVDATHPIVSLVSALVEAPDGDLVIAAGRYNAPGQLLKVSRSGDLRWSIDLIRGTDPKIAIADDGSIFVGITDPTDHDPGDARHEGALTYPWLGRFDPAGTLQWSRYDWPSIVAAETTADAEAYVDIRDVTLDSEGHLMALGSAIAGPPWLGRFDRETGAELDSRSLDGFVGFGALSADGLGGVVVADHFKLARFENDDPTPYWSFDAWSTEQLAPGHEAWLGVLSREIVESPPEVDAPGRMALTVLEPDRGVARWSRTIEASTHDTHPYGAVAVGTDRFVAAIESDGASGRLLVFQL